MNDREAIDAISEALDSPNPSNLARILKISAIVWQNEAWRQAQHGTQFDEAGRWLFHPEAPGRGLQE